MEGGCSRTCRSHWCHCARQCELATILNWCIPCYQDRRLLVLAESSYVVDLTCYLNITEVCFGIISDDSSESSCVQHILEFPEGIAGKVLSC